MQREVVGEEERGRGEWEKRPEGRLAAAVTGLQSKGRLGDMAVLREWQVKPSGGNFFSLQVGAEAEGSGLGWGLDVGSGSGDLVLSEELLRVSVRVAQPAVWDCLLNNWEDSFFPSTCVYIWHFPPGSVLF